MNGPYTITIRDGGTVSTKTHARKRAAIAMCRRLIRAAPEGTLGDVADADGEYVRQLIAARGASGAVIAKEREL